MRHKRKRHHLSRAADQRHALIRTMVTSLIKHEEVVVTLPRAKALKEEADKLITLGKAGNVPAMRQALRHIYNHPTGEMMTTESGKTITKTVLRKLFNDLAPRFQEVNGGYTRVIKAPPRRGDAAPMAVVQFTH